MSKVNLIIPIGPGAPEQDAPNLEMMVFGFERIKKQTLPIKLTCAVDRDLPENKMKVIREYANEVRLFEPHSYFTGSGIWGKIYKCWESTDCEYVAWNGYDDYSGVNRFECQSKMLEKTGADACFCCNYLDTEGKITLTNNGLADLNAMIGGHASYMGAFLLRKSFILNSGINLHREKWACYFEGLLNAFILRGKIVNSEGEFYYRNHRGTISNTWKQQWFEESFRKTGYSIVKCKADWESINFSEICNETKRILNSRS